VYILTGNYRSDALPRYLRPAFKDTITKRLDRVKLFQGPIQKANVGNFDAFNLSDIYEYMNPEEFQICYQQLLARANKGGRFAYWNMLVPRSVPSSLKQRLRNNDQLSKTLHFQDKAWFYQAFVVDEVIG
jgi:S-adenosylmethionine-diacylglycerol 3-amino-3-carboxypropyl transferase